MELNTVTTNYNNKKVNSTNKAKYSIDEITRQWKTNQIMEEQQCEKDIHKHVGTFKAAVDTDVQQRGNDFDTVDAKWDWKYDIVKDVLR